MRSKAALLVVSLSSLLTLALAGCGSPATVASPSTGPSTVASETTPSASPTSPAPTAHPSVKPTDTLDGITVSGAFGKDPGIAFKSPFAIDKTRSKVLVAGKGPALTDTSYIYANYHGVNGYTAKTFDNSWTRGQPVLMSLGGVVPGFKAGLVGKHVGDRVLIAIPGKDGYDSQGGSGDGSILVGDTLVFVVDILDTDYQKPYGKTVAPKAGLPAVTTDAKGVPSVAIDTAATPPTEAVAQPIVAGSGTYKIGASDQIMVRYREYSWQTGKLLTDRFTGDPDVGPLADTLPCWNSGLVGKPLGSRLLLVCPPATGYPEGNPTPSIAKGDTVVYVIDLMLAAAAGA